MTRSDEEIKKDIVDALFWDARVDASQVKVEVESGNVTLSGSVPSYTAKIAARENSLLTYGVISVKNNITVNIPSNMKRQDKDIKEDVKNALLLNPDLNVSEISVSSNDGEVTLEGNVDMLWKKFEAEDSTYDVSGVWNVINRITIVPLNKIDDKLIADDVMSSLKRNAAVDEKSINVTVEDGVVTLSGNVSDLAAYTNAEDSAQFTSGVIGVENRLNIVS
jgi:osmotically-inducible protein OsmY